MEKEKISKEITIDDLFRLRASSGIANLDYKRTGNKDVPFSVHVSGLAANPIAYFGNENAVKLFCKLNDIINFGINASLENDKLKKTLSRSHKQSTIF